MAPPRTFDYEKLEQMISDHPDWPYARLADELTRDNRRWNPDSPRVKPDSVRRVVSQYRAEWEELGVNIPVRGIVHTDLAPPLGMVPASQRMTTPLRYLREISAERRGEAPVTSHGTAMRRQALGWEARLRENREIVDITDNGIVEVRPARADELDTNGQLDELAAWAIPGYQPRHRVSGRGRGLCYDVTIVTSRPVDSSGRASLQSSFDRV